jgi:hypothetical protein
VGIGRNPIHCWRDCKLAQSLWKSVGRFLKKLKIGLPNDPVIPLLGLYSKESKPAYNTDTCTSMFMAALITVAKLWNQFRCPSRDEWKKKMWCIYTMEF